MGPDGSDDEGFVGFGGFFFNIEIILIEVYSCFTDGTRCKSCILCLDQSSTHSISR